MTSAFRPLMAALVGITLTGAACGGDGSDVAAEIPAGQTTTVPPTVEPADDMAGDASIDTEPPAPTVPAVEPTGVVVPVIALDNSFRPQVVEISVGDEVLWQNRGLNEHNALSVVGDDWGVEVAQFQPGDVYAHVFTEPGEYDYFCSIHGNETVGMVGKIIVTG